MPDKKTLLKDVINGYFDKFLMSGSSSAYFHGAFPQTFLHPRDYLEYAEIEMKQLENGENHLINCVGHLKRAIDSQLDTFLQILGVHSVFQKRSLKFDKKLEFLKEIDVVSPRTLSRFNRIRNEIEHKFNLPLDLDVEVFFDLSTAFISSIELTIVLLTRCEITYDILKYGDRYEEVDGVFVSTNKDENKDEPEIIKGDFFEMNHQFPSPEISASWNLDGKQETINIKLSNSSSESDVAEFAYFIKVFVLLLKFDGFGTSNLYVYDHI
ncbi:MAG TPA: hypothetical protein PLR65_03275 [Anaerolineales bacterium]|nr:hypothetical protein [Anaerolineales bacterium]